MILLLPNCDQDSLWVLAQHLAQLNSILLLGIVPVPVEENLSTGVNAARQLRDLIHWHIDRLSLRARARIRVSHTPWEDICLVLSEEPEIDLIILSYPDQLKTLKLSVTEILSHPPCDIALLRGSFPKTLHQILFLNFGDLPTQRALDLSLNLATSGEAKITFLNLHQAKFTSQNEETILSDVSRVLAKFPEHNQRTLTNENHAQTIKRISRDFDLIVLGTKTIPAKSTEAFGHIVNDVWKRSLKAVMVVKTKEDHSKRDKKYTDFKAKSIAVDRWFAENTFHADEFANLNRLLALKNERGLTISLALPALNEADTIGDIIRTNQRVLMEETPLLDEIILIDSNSTDQTREIAINLGIPVYTHQHVLPQYGSREGKGEALWKSLFVSKGDIIIWVDTDIRNFHPRFVYGLIGPLLYWTSLNFIKGFYRRPFRVGKELIPGYGGRVTELSVRPLINLFFPELSGIIQPLAGECGGRREVLEKMPFSSNFGVEIGLLIDLYEKYGLASLAQVDLLERIHNNQPLTNLSKMSFGIMQTLLSKHKYRFENLSAENANRILKIVHNTENQYHLEDEKIIERLRPPMIEIPEYQHKHK